MNYSIDIYTLRAYFDGELNEEDTRSIESMALANPEFADELRRFQKDYEISKQQWRSQVRQQLKRSDRRRILFGKYATSIAAIIALILAAIWFLFKKENRNNVISNIELLLPLLDDPVNSYAWNNRTIVWELSSSPIGNLYLEGKYDEVAELTDGWTVHNELFFLRGLSLFRVNRVEEAVMVFAQLSNPANQSKWLFPAKWNLLVLYCSAPRSYEQQLCALLKQVLAENYYQADSLGYKSRLKEIDFLLKKKHFSCPK